LIGNLIYPEIYDFDINEEVKTFLKLFYNYDLSDEEVGELIKNSN
jgi:iron complex transport system substrate-binding protein